MTIEIVYGSVRNRNLADELSASLSKSVPTGTLYLGYPVLTSSEHRVNIDGLLVSQDHGLVALLLPDIQPTSDVEWAAAVDEQNRLYAVLDSHLGKYDILRQGRKLSVSIETISVYPQEPNRSIDQENGKYCSIEKLPSVIAGIPGIAPETEKRLQSVVQSVSSIRPHNKRESVKRENSKGAKMKIIERSIANLDKWQKKAAIETPESPQRIRGLAGSGKTIVLALKAAYLHSQHPDWNIAVTFQSRSLYQQFEDLISRFTFEHIDEPPDFTKLQILHSWGSASRLGVYSIMAGALEVPRRDFDSAKQAFGNEDAFEGACKELLEAIEVRGDIEPLFDAVLIDEAQDLPPAFFQLLYRFTRPPKRIVWAYDELQKLSDAVMPGTDELFAKDSSGNSRVELNNPDKGPRQDVVLQLCYRNTPWALTTAHAIGFGIYREEGPVQHFDDPSTWNDIGYKVLDGALTPGSSVTLIRDPTSYPGYFSDLISKDEAVEVQVFNDPTAQDEWIAEQIFRNINDDELEPRDILVVLPDPRNARQRAHSISRKLEIRNIAAHLVGVQTSQDRIFQENSIAITHIHRAKGNEAAVVYVADAQYAVAPYNQIVRRNVLFTAITRSRAWVRISGYGSSMSDFANEIEMIKDSDYQLTFTVPTPEELTHMRRVNREMSNSEIYNIQKLDKSIEDIISTLSSEKVMLDDIRSDRIEALKRALSRMDINED